jgi:hypothetical protein
MKEGIAGPDRRTPMKESTAKDRISFNIPKITVPDGPVKELPYSLKDDPMNCLWCSNPERINHIPRWFFKNLHRY